MLKKIVQSKYFSGFILSVVLLNSLVLGLLTSPDITAKCGGVLIAIDRACLFIFVLEAVMKIWVWKFEYFKRGWNLFDFSIVVVSLLSDFTALSSMRTLRILRVFRTLKFISGVKNLQIIVSAIGRSIPSIGWTAMLMSIVYYIFAIMGTVLFGEAFPVFFGSMGKSMFSLFQIMTLEAWAQDMCRPIMEVYPWAWLFFVPFVVLSSFVILNIVVGIVVNSISEITAARNSEKRQKAGQEVDLEAELRAMQQHMDKLKDALRQKSQQP